MKQARKKERRTLSSFHLDQRWLLLLGLLILVVVASWQALEYRSFIIDDAYITFRYADRLSQGEGLSYNPGKHIEGYSNFLLVLLLALGSKLGVSPPLLSQLIGLSSLLILIALCFDEAQRRTGTSPGALIAPAILASSSALAFWAVSGLETLLYTLLLSASTIVMLRINRGECNEGTASNLVLYFLLSLLMLCRIEGSAIALIIAGFHALHRRSFWKSVSPLLIVIVIYHSFRFLYFGTLRTGPSIAKLSGSISPMFKGFTYLKGFFFEYAPSFLLFALILALLRRSLSSKTFLLLSLFQLLVILIIGGDWMPMYRMLIPLFPLAALEISSSLRCLCKRAPSLPAAVTAAVLLSCISLSFFPLSQSVKINQGKLLDRLFLQVAKYLKKNFPNDTTLVLGDIGRIGYVTGFKIIDVKGLVSPWVSETYKKVKEDEHFRMSIDADKILERRPDLVLIAINERSKSMPRQRIPRERIPRERIPRERMPRQHMSYQGFWSCDTDLLESEMLEKHWRLVAKIGEGNSLGVSYLLFEKKSGPCP